MPRGWAGWAVATAVAQGHAVASAATMGGNVQSAVVECGGVKIGLRTFKSQFTWVSRKAKLR